MSLQQGLPQFPGMAASQSVFLLSGPLCYTIPQTPSYGWERQAVCKPGALATTSNITFVSADGSASARVAPAGKWNRF